MSREIKVTLRDTRPGERRLTPGTISIPRLTEILKQIDQGARAYTPKNISEDNDDIIIALTGIKEGSLECIFSVEPEILPYIAEFTIDIEQRHWNKMPLKAYNAIFELHKSLDKLGASLEIHPDIEIGIAEVHLSHYEAIPEREAAHLTGETTLSGELVQAGGAKPKIDFRLDMTGKIMHIDVPENVAKKLGSRLYQPITITGDATWNSETWEIEKFIFKDVIETESTDSSSSLDALHRILGDTWFGVDVEEFMLELRGGREE
jgi:hypothetical protein